MNYWNGFLNWYTQKTTNYSFFRKCTDEINSVFCRPSLQPKGDQASSDRAAFVSLWGVTDSLLLSVSHYRAAPTPAVHFEHTTFNHSHTACFVLFSAFTCYWIPKCFVSAAETCMLLNICIIPSQIQQLFMSRAWQCTK